MSDALELAIKLSTPLGALVNLLTILVLISQVRTMRQELKAQSHIEMVARWNAVSEFELSNPELHRLLLGPKALLATSQLDASMLKKRAFAHMVFDVISQRFKVDREIGIQAESMRYLEVIMKNPELAALWSQYEIREAFEGDPFQAAVDKCVASLKAPAEPGSTLS